MSTQNALTAVRKFLGHGSIKWTPNAWLSTKIEGLNCIFGHADKGMLFGKMIEVSGWESSGKSSVSLALSALAQIQGAIVVWLDLENSWDPRWAIQRGIAACSVCKGEGSTNENRCEPCMGSGADPTKLILLQPYVGKFGNEREERQISAQELCEELENVLRLEKKRNPENKFFVVVDSIPALLTEGESDAGISGANMRSDMEISKLMGRLMRRWVGKAQIFNAIVLWINQLREGPGGMAKTPGGNATRFYCHVRVRVARVKSSKIIAKGRCIGIKGIMTAKKNKCGGEEGAQIGYKLMFKGPLQFVPAKDVIPKEEK